MREFEIRKSIINPEKLDRPQFLYLGAHTDDDAMAKLTAVLDANGYGLTIGTLTDSADYDEELIPIRWDEQIASGDEGGVTEVRRMESPDGSLQYNIESGIWFAGDFVDEIQPVAIITPHQEDLHPDHVAAFKIGKAVAGNRTPHYTTDTIYGTARNGSRLVPDIYMPLTYEQVVFEDRIYQASKSQMKGSNDNEAVFNMARRRGAEIGRDFAAVSFEERVVYESPLRDISRGAVMLR